MLMRHLRGLISPILHHWTILFLEIKEQPGGHGFYVHICPQLSVIACQISEVFSNFPLPVSVKTHPDSPVPVTWGDLWLLWWPHLLLYTELKSNDGSVFLNNTDIFSWTKLTTWWFSFSDWMFCGAHWVSYCVSALSSAAVRPELWTTKS